jgi:hypothetical protein
MKKKENPTYKTVIKDSSGQILETITSAYKHPFSYALILVNNYLKSHPFNEALNLEISCLDSSSSTLETSI